MDVVDDRWTHWFSVENLTQLFWKKIRYRCSPGLDRVGITSFTEKLDENIEIINRKVLNGTYTFTKYNELLISKGRNKNPRCVSRPTIRDKLALCALHGYLQEIYRGKIDNRLIHSKVDEVVKNIPKYTHCVKIDLVGFYQTIDHELLNIELSKTISPFILDIINKAITTVTVPKEFNSKLLELPAVNVGVPEGLSISNLLAAVYLNPFDTCFEKYPNTYFCRYVDDILILANEEDIESVKEESELIAQTLKLTIHDFKDPDKSYVVSCDKGFSYLGYHFSNEMITVKPAGVDRFEHSLERMFSDYKKEEKNPQRDTIHNKDMFAWKLNLKISGCIYNARKYGWMFFYSQITDLSLLKHFDWLVHRLYDRYSIEQSTIERKSFFKTYHEIRYNLNDSNYLYNIDRMSQEDMESIIGDVFHYLIPDHKKDVEQTFFNILNKNLKELERDIQFFS